MVKICERGITLNDGTYIEDSHEQDCCEHVYADWNELKTQTGALEMLEALTLEKVDITPCEYGFRMNGFFVPCYNEQNGYYSNDLSILVNGTGVTLDLENMECIYK
jgi:hypothetical protein